jgi:hypothetical protein
MKGGPSTEVFFAQNSFEEPSRQPPANVRVYPPEPAFEKMPRSIISEPDDFVTAWPANIILPNTA